MYWELYQQRKIGEANSTASRAKSKAEQVSLHIQYLEDKVDSLSLACQALWEILRDRSSLTEDELITKINEIDLRDGKADGKMGSTGRRCGGCNRTLNPRHARCMYCGEHAEKEHVFQG